MQEIPVDAVIYRSDLYPRIETSAVTVQKYAEDLDVLPPIEPVPGSWTRVTQRGIEISFVVAFPEVCPESLRNLSAGFVSGGAFYPSGSVAKYFFLEQQRLRKERRPHEKPPHVYFIQAGPGGPVKIGIAKIIKARLAGLQTNQPQNLVLVGIVPHGGRETERLFHARFAPYRMAGEWFKWNTELAEVLR